MNKRLVFLAISMLTLAACSRSTDLSSTTGKSKVSFLVPIGLSSQAALPVGKKACYGVKVSAPDIKGALNSCNPVFGQYVGFKAEGQSLSIEVQKGDNRSFSLVTYLADENDTCPNWDSDFSASFARLQNTYIVGTTAAVSLKSNDETVTITYEFPGVGNNIAVQESLASCKLRGSLYSNGSVLNPAGDLISNFETTEGYYSTSLSGVFAVGIVTTGGILNLGLVNPVQVPEYVFSLTRKPDTGDLFGLVGDGRIVKVILPNIAAGTGFVYTAAIEELTATTCPFTVPSCKVPPWMQSISAGFTSELYGLDHGGNIYSLQATGINLEDKVSEAVRQVSYY